jgi:hypothetical protein
MSKPAVSDGFDGLDAIEKAALNRCRALAITRLVWNGIRRGKAVHAVSCGRPLVSLNCASHTLGSRCAGARVARTASIAAADIERWPHKVTSLPEASRTRRRRSGRSFAAAARRKQVAIKLDDRAGQANSQARAEPCLACARQTGTFDTRPPQCADFERAKFLRPAIIAPLGHPDLMRRNAGCDCLMRCGVSSVSIASSGGSRTGVP